MAAITVPSGTTVSRGSSVTLTATASDNTGIKVVFKVYDVTSTVTLIKTCATDTTAPYNCVWSVPNGNNKKYRIDATATNNNPVPRTITVSKTVSAN